MKKVTAICKLVEPATCIHRVDGKFAWVILCGGNGLDDKVNLCPMRQIATLTLLEEGKDEF